MPVRERIEFARDLRIPSKKRDEVLESLTDEGRQRFLEELIEALAAAEVFDDLSQVQYVVNAWWVSRLFFTHPEIDAALSAADQWSDDEPLYTAQEIGELLGVA